MPYDVLLERTLLAVRSGLDVCTHAIGDEANRLVLDSFEAVRAEGHDSLLRIEHAQHVRPVDIPRFRALDVIASMQPSHCTADLELADQIIGPRRLASYAWRSFLDAGVRRGLRVRRAGRGPEPLLRPARRRDAPAGGRPARSAGGGPEERITLDEAVHAHTVVAHESVGRTDVGRLVPGQLADLVVVDRDLWALEESAPADDPRHRGAPDLGGRRARLRAALSHTGIRHRL